MHRSPKNRLLRGVLTRKTVSWALYDFANSAYILIIAAVGFAVYYRTIVLQGDDRADAYWAVLVSCSLAAAGISAPFFGALADVARIRRGLFVATTVVCCVASALLFTAGPGDVVIGTLLFFVAHSAYGVAIALYDSYLRDLSHQKSSGFTSGFAWGVGYIGGLVCLAICYPLLRGGLEASNLSAYRLAFPITAGFYLTLSLPAFFLLPRQSGFIAEKRRTGEVVRAAYRELWQTIRGWRNNKEIFKFLLSFYFISDAIVTVIFFTAIFLQTNFEMTVQDVLIWTVIVQVVGVFATPIFGWLGDLWGKKQVILVSLVIWSGVIATMVFGTERYIVQVMGFLMGLVIGSTQALCRGLMSDMVPAERATELFGFNTFAGKVSAVLGPLLFGAVSTATGSQRWGLVSLFGFFVVGGFLLSMVRVPDNLESE